VTLSIHIKKLKELIFIYTYHMLNQKKLLKNSSIQIITLNFSKSVSGAQQP